MNLRAAALLALVLTIIGTTTSLSAASAQTATAQDGLTAAFCTNLSLGGPRTFPFDSNGDDVADVCSLPYTRREAIARQNALERLALQYPSTFLTFVKQECRLLASQDFGDSPTDLAEDVCATGTLTPPPTVENQPPQFYSGVVSGPSFCANLSLGGPKTYPFDSNGDDVADVCSLAYTRREAIARQNALQKLAQRFVADSNLWLVEACAALRSQNTDFGDNPADLAKDICQPSTRPGGGGGGGGGGSPGGGGPGGPGTQPQQTVPGAPTQLRIIAGNAKLTVRWTAPANGGADITDYDVQYRACTATPLSCTTSPTWGSWTEWNASNTSTGTTATVTGLTNGTAYQVQVLAQNSVGVGPWSATGEATPSTQPPSAPTALRLTVADKSLGVSWSAPSDNGGSAITGYKVGRCSANCDPVTNWPDTNWTVATLNSTGTTTTLSGLTNGTPYQVRVAATNAIGDSPLSDSATATPATTPDAPDAPTLTVKNKSLGVSWSAPAGNGAAITDYDVQYRACTKSADLTCASSPSWGSWTNHSHTGTATTATISSLTNGTAYQVQVQAKNSVGTGAWSSSARATPVPQPPDAPSAPTVTVWNKELRLSWTAPSINGSAITDYDVQYQACTATPLSCTTSPTWGSWTEWNASNTSTGTTATVTGLTNDTAYQVQVRAGAGAGDGAWSASTKATPTAQRPSRPGAPTLTYGNASLSVAWTAPSDNGAAITGYRVRRCDNSLDCRVINNWRPTDITGTGTSTMLTGLTNGTTYQVQVRATNRVGPSPFSLSAEEKPYTVPSAPDAPTLTVQSAALAVSWQAPTSDGGDQVTGYEVGYCTANCGTDTNWTVATLNSTGTATRLSPLANGTAYQVRVAATNSAGDSAWSASTTATPATTPAAPSAPTLSVKNTSLGVSWTAPTNGGADITDYDVQYRACTATDKTCTSSPSWPNIWTSHTHTGTATTATITGLTNGTAYQVQVRAANSRGDGNWSPSSKKTPNVKPGTPLQPSVTPKSPASLIVTWTAQGTATGYNVRYQKRTSGSWERTCVDHDNNDETPLQCYPKWTPHTHSGTSTTATISGLTAGDVYRVQVQASNSAGNGNWSIPSIPRAAGEPKAPTVKVSVANKALVVSWTTQNSTESVITDYDVQYRPGTSGTWTDRTGETTSDTATTVIVTGLTNSTAYQVQVRASNSAGDGAWSTRVSGTPAITAPFAPAAPTLQTDYQALVVSWTEPNNNGSDITDYDVQYRFCSAFDKTCVISPSWNGQWWNWATNTATTVRLTGLDNGTAYQVRVRAANDYNSNGSNDYSSWSLASKGIPNFAPPGPPTGVTLSLAGDGMLEVEWNKPLLIGAPSATYDLRYRKCQHTGEEECTYPGNTPNWGNWTSGGSTTDSAATSKTLTGLTNGYAHQVQVRGNNSNHTGDWSTTSAALIPGTPKQPTKPTLSYNNKVLTVTWTAPAANGSPITHYAVQYQACTNSSDLTCQTNPSWGSWTQVSRTQNDTTTTSTVSGLTDGTAYRARVVAHNANGNSGWSDPGDAAFARPPNKPNTPTLIPSSGSIKVDWTAPNTNGSRIKSYTVQYRACTNTMDLSCQTNPSWAPSWTSSDVDLAGSNLNCGTDLVSNPCRTTLTGLTNGTAYQVRLRAVSDAGNSDWSDIDSSRPS